MEKESFIQVGEKFFKLVEVSEKQVKKTKVIDPDVKGKIPFKVYVAYSTSDGCIFSLTDECPLKEGRYENKKDVLIIKHITLREAKFIEKKALPYEGFFSGMVDFFARGGKQSVSKDKPKNPRLQIGDKRKRPKYDSAILLLRPDYVEAVNLLKSGLSMKVVSKAMNISYTSVYKLNVSFCGYEPKPYKPRENVKYKGKTYKKNGINIRQTISITKTRSAFGLNDTETEEHIFMNKFEI